MFIVVLEEDGNSEWIANALGGIGPGIVKLSSKDFAPLIMLKVIGVINKQGLSIILEADSVDRFLSLVGKYKNVLYVLMEDNKVNINETCCLRLAYNEDKQEKDTYVETVLKELKKRKWAKVL